MKYITIFLIGILTFSCSNWIMSETSSTLVLDPDTAISYNFSTVADAWKFVCDDIAYKLDAETGYADYWQTPAETVDRMAGDCEDKAILFMHLVYRLGYSPVLVGVEYADGSQHVMTLLDGVYYGETPWLGEYKIIVRLGYANALLSIKRFTRQY